MTIAFGFGYLLGAQHVIHETLSEFEARTLAVELANDECYRLYAERPFDERSFEMEFRRERWKGGVLDLAGVAGLSAIVSFDAYGHERVVDVFFSQDAPRVRALF